MDTTLKKVRSSDGTPIAVEVMGTGPAVVLIEGAFNDRSTMAGLAHTLAPHFTAVTYDRRGRGDSGDAEGFAVESEMDDLAAVIDHVGGKASLFGHSSGAVLGIEAAIRGLTVDRLAIYEPPYIPEGSRPRPGADVSDRLRQLVEQERRDEAVVLYQTEVIGFPPEMVEGMRRSDMWGWLTRIAHTLPYDFALFEPGCILPTERLANVTVSTLAIAGSNTFGWLRSATREVAKAIPGSHYLELDGHDHSVLQQPAVLRAPLVEFFG
jgi:pimeloyl-ACP methyl ester carboxylesterase